MVWKRRIISIKKQNMKCALVTGGSRGIGSAICKKLAASKEYHILINYQSNVEAAEKTLEAVNEIGATGEIIKFNVYTS